MNHLAHLFLSQSDINLMIGNFIADHVKGKQIESYTLEIQKGIRMHRAIDDFTDHHPIVQRSKERLYPKYHKYSAVIVDMFYDHILARNWSDYSPLPLTKFTQSVYQVLNAHKASFPETSKRFLYYMSQYDWLNSYGTEEGIDKALSGLSRRTKFVSKMEESSKELVLNYADFKLEFEAFFPKLNEFCIDWLRQND